MDETFPMKVMKAPRGLVFAALAFGWYTLSYAANSIAGGYWGKPERDGRDRYHFGLSMHSAVLWQPRFGYWALYRSDALGTFYSPLIRLDRRFIHPTRYLTDPTFESWVQTMTPSDRHPRFR